MPREIRHHVTVELTDSREILSLLARLLAQGEQLMALSAAQAAKLEALKTTIDTATSGLRSDIQALKDAITAGSAAEDPAVTAAFNDLAVRLAPLQALDSENPPATPPVPPIDQV